MRLAKRTLSQDPGAHRLARERADAIKVYQDELAGKHAAAPRIGLKEGCQSRSESRAEVLLKHLGLRFGRPSAATHARVQRATAEELDSWATRVLTARTLAEVFGR